MGSRRRFGALRQLPSGRWQASYVAPDGLRRRAPQTFPTKTDGEQWLVVIEAQLLSQDWRDPSIGRVRLSHYAKAWIDQRPNLRPKTLDLYRWLDAKYLQPALGYLPLAGITAPRVRSWRADLLASGVSESTCAKAYRLLRAILNTAVADSILARNPCRIPGAGLEHPAERPTLTIEQVMALSQQMPPRFGALVIVATFGSLRYGEATALHREDVDLNERTVTVRATFIERSNGAMELGPPKSRAGVRTIVLPDFAAQTLAEHLDEYVGQARDALIFTGVKGGPLRRSQFNPTVDWREAVTAIGVPHLHFHDLRHTGNTLAAGTPGTSTRDLMERMGHDSTRAALIYQHATREADSRIADALDLQNPPRCGHSRGGHCCTFVARPSAAESPGTALGRRKPRKPGPA